MITTVDAPPSTDPRADPRPELGDADHGTPRTPAPPPAATTDGPVPEAAETIESGSAEHDEPRTAGPERQRREPWLARTIEATSHARHRAWKRRRVRRQAVQDENAPSAGNYRIKRSGIHVAYVISLAMSGYGQTRFFASWLGLGLGVGDIWKGAIGAVFLELSMVGADGYSMYQRRTHPEGGWLPLRVIAWVIALFGAVLNYAHFGAGPHGNIGIACMFSAATLIGFVLQDITGHLKVRAYLDRAGTLPERSRIGFLRWVIYRKDAYRIWKMLVADPSRSADTEFRRIVATVQHPAPAEITTCTEPAPTPADPQLPGPRGEDVRGEESTAAEHEPVRQSAPPPDAEPVTDEHQAEPVEVVQPGEAPEPAADAEPRRLALVHDAKSTETTAETELADGLWIRLIRPIAQELYDAGDWLSNNDVIRIARTLAAQWGGTSSVGRDRATRVLTALAQESAFTDAPKARRGKDRPVLTAAVQAQLDTAAAAPVPEAAAT